MRSRQEVEKGDSTKNVRPISEDRTRAASKSRWKAGKDGRAHILDGHWKRMKWAVGEGRGKAKKEEQGQEIDTYTLRDAEVLVFVARRVDGRKACGRSVASQ